MLFEKHRNNGFDDTQINQIETVLGYKFKDASLLVNALTRRSFWHENKSFCSDHNERMEFLGDAVLGLVVADMLYREFRDDEEGELQKKRASLVNRSALAKLMRKLELAPFIRMTKGDEFSGNRDRDSILADTLEAVIAAVFIDGGFASAQKLIHHHFYPLLKKCSRGERIEDCKSLLQEKAQAERGITPTYEVVGEWGEDHCKTFSVAVCLGSQILGIGSGRNKREAAQNAAREALEKWNDSN